MLADQDQGSVKRPKQPDLAGQAQASRRTKRSSKSFGDVKDNLKRRRRFYDAQVLALGRVECVDAFKLYIRSDTLSAN